MLIKTNVASLFICLLFCTEAVSQNIASYTPLDGLVLWESLSTDLDSNTSNYGGTLTTDRFGNSQGARHFDGRSLIEFEIPFDLPERTISFWYYPTLEETDLQVVFCYDNPSLRNGHSIVAFTDAKLSMHLGTPACEKGLIQYNEWNFITLTRGRELSIFYVDGALQCSMPNDTIASKSAVISNVILGASRNFDRFFQGNIDDVGLWNRALNECEIQDLFKAQKSSSVATIQEIDNTLSLIEEGDSYQWYVCDDGWNLTPIAGATEQEFTPTQSGEYAVSYIKNGCEVFSNCFSFTITGINEPYLSTGIFPNPTSNSIAIELAERPINTMYKLFSASGACVLSGPLKLKTNTLDISPLVPGVYFLRITKGEMNSFHEILKY